MQVVVLYVIIMSPSRDLCKHLSFEWKAWAFSLLCHQSGPISRTVRKLLKYTLLALFLDWTKQKTVPNFALFSKVEVSICFHNLFNKMFLSILNTSIYMWSSLLQCHWRSRNRIPTPSASICFRCGNVCFLAIFLTVCLWMQLQLQFEHNVEHPSIYIYTIVFLYRNCGKGLNVLVWLLSRCT